MKRIISFQDIDKMDGHDFEYFCAEVLKKNGFSRVNVTVASGDYGIDITACQGATSYAIQCKRYQGSVGNKAVQEALSGKVYYGCKAAAVLTNSYFTPQAKETAHKTGVELWDRDKLTAMVKKAYPGQIWIPKQKKTKPKQKPKKKANRRAGCLPWLLFWLSVIILLIAYFVPKMEYYEAPEQEKPVATEAPTTPTVARETEPQTEADGGGEKDRGEFPIGQETPIDPKASGKTVVSGVPAEIITPELIHRLYDIDAALFTHRGELYLEYRS